MNRILNTFHYTAGSILSNNAKNFVFFYNEKISGKFFGFMTGIYKQ